MTWLSILSVVLLYYIAYIIWQSWCKNDYRVSCMPLYAIWKECWTILLQLQVSCIWSKSYSVLWGWTNRTNLHKLTTLWKN